VKNWPFFLLLFTGCRFEESAPSIKNDATFSAKNKASILETSKRQTPDFFKKSSPKSLPTLQPDRFFNAAVGRSIDFLSENGKKSTAKLGNGIAESDLMSMLLAVQNGACIDPVFLTKYVEFYELQTDKPNDQTLVTGYFTPILSAQKTRSNIFSTPIYKNPADKISTLPSRSDIEKGILSGKNLEIGWLRSQKDLRSVQMQGSCFLKFEDGSMRLIGWDGTNRGGKNEQLDSPIFDEKILETEPENASKISKKGKKFAKKHAHEAYNYVFLKTQKSAAPKGAMSAELTPSISVSVDPRIVPLGAVLLAEIADFIDSKKPPKYRILLAQDVGGGIRGSGRIDMYCGAGTAFSPVFPINDFAKIWLLLPK
jgi:membrane-bound lytic murein transglycosylase A